MFHPQEIIPDFLIANINDNFCQAIHDLTTNQEFPTIDKEAFMDYLFGQIKTDESFDNASSVEDEILFLLEDTVGHLDKLEEKIVNKIIEKVYVVVMESLLLLEKHGVFINGKQPYEFGKFIDTNTLLFRKAQVFDY